MARLTIGYHFIFAPQNKSLLMVKQFRWLVNALIFIVINSTE